MNKIFYVLNEKKFEDRQCLLMAEILNRNKSCAYTREVFLELATWNIYDWTTKSIHSEGLYTYKIINF